MISYIKILRTFFFRSNTIVKRIVLKRVLGKTNLNDMLFSYEIKSYKKKMPLLRIESLIDYKIIFNESIDSNLMNFTCNKYLSHHFNILGSGWISSDYKAQVLGIEGVKYLADPVRPFVDIVKARVDKNYSPIDWHRDLKSGYLFDAEKSASKVSSNLPEGVDLKMPWELARMYHLPQMALMGISMHEKRETLIKEFKFQIIDFCESNPIGQGVNWNCTMEVAIRVVNILIAYDLFLQIDNYNVLDEEFKIYISSEIMKHGRFIIRNLELNFVTNKNGNHYLSNLCGLLFVASYYKNKETKKWFKFASVEFLSEFDKQFLEDGGNYECSTVYHRLSAEISAYSMALLIRNGVEIEQRFLKKLNSAAHFAALTKKHDGNIIQIGDNDSGRLIKLDLIGEFLSVKDYEEKYYNLSGYSDLYKDNQVFDENELSVNSLLAIVYAITKYNYLKTFYKEFPLDYKIMIALLNNKTLISDEAFEFTKQQPIISIDDFNLSTLINKQITKIIFPVENLNLKNSTLNYSPDFGLAVFELDNFKLFVRSVADLGIMHNAHLHNDFLHFEVSYGLENYFSDQGSYIYTPLINRRNQFRSVKAHNIPYHGIETNNLKDCFSVKVNITGKIVELTNCSIGMILYFADIVHYRRIELNQNVITILDKSNKPFLYDCKEAEYSSSGYGALLSKRIKNTKLLIEKKINYQ
ncbi:heparinase II/III family protein [Paenibacillus wynnii]|uniref:Uncharacterized protein n=1 Tax=Paenibacillus wynnii TaxID=268407 RepID=A0A098M9W2_9BACL|nr:heparinase II/III family protein [Paenibacillus wynnii]KGE18322.1 hypothetical protein PWYN_27805 [Paenibacillus wynnii]